MNVIEFLATFVSQHVSLAPPPFPYWGLSMLFGFSAALSIYALLRYKDYTYVAMIPALLYMTLHFAVVYYVPDDVANIWRTWGLFALGGSILISKFWRLSYFLRGKRWKH